MQERCRLLILSTSHCGWILWTSFIYSFLKCKRVLKTQMKTRMEIWYVSKATEEHAFLVWFELVGFAILFSDKGSLVAMPRKCPGHWAYSDNKNAILWLSPLRPLCILDYLKVFLPVWSWPPNLVDITSFLLQMVSNPCELQEFAGLAAPQ